MAPSSPCLNSRLHSTSGILACLDLNDSPKKAMEDMDLDKVIEIPDTPDQIASNYGEPVETGGSPSVHLGNSNYSDEGLVFRPRYRVRMGNENGHYRRLRFLPPKNPSDYSKSERHQSDCTGVQHIDKGKALCTEFASTPSVCQYNKAVVNINEQSPNDLVLQNGVLRDKLTNSTSKDICEGSFEGCGHFPLATNRPCKILDVTNDYTCEGGNVDCREGTDFLSKSQLEAENSESCTHSNILSRRVSGQKRLVRNGCISPHNIAKAKQVAGKIDNSSKNLECTGGRTILINGTPCVSGVNGLPPEDINANKVKLKGKGVLTHTSTTMEIPLSSRNPKNHKDEADRSVAGYNVSDSLQGLNGWISTRNRTKKIHHPCSEGSQGHIRRKDTCIAAINRNTVEDGPNGSGINKTASDYTEVQNVDSFLIGTVQSSEVVNVRQRAAKALIKRQRKQASASSHPGQCSTSVSSNAGIVCLDSPGESSNSISMGPQRQGLRHRHAVHPVIEIDESSPLETSQCVSQHVGCCDNDSDARAMQLEADERLARELQEQLYHESPVFSGVEVDAHVAWALQQEEATHARSTRSHRNSLPRGSLASHTRSHSRSDRSNLIRRENHGRISTSNRMTQLRRRIQNQLPAAMSGERFSFPASMNLEARLNVLEALEASAIGNTGRVTNILRVQRDFNENDYEMLLTLDENNDNHSGASTNLINSLPQTVVQNASFEEACAICLETPTTGDSIRHLPCLHKFHKDCIDPWLSRKTSCPVCKSSIR